MKLLKMYTKERGRSIEKGSFSMGRSEREIERERERDRQTERERERERDWGHELTLHIFFIFTNNKTFYCPSSACWRCTFHTIK